MWPPHSDVLLTGRQWCMNWHTHALRASTAGQRLWASRRVASGNPRAPLQHGGTVPLRPCHAATHLCLFCTVACWSSVSLCTSRRHQMETSAQGHSISAQQAATWQLLPTSIQPEGGERLPVPQADSSADQPPQSHKNVALHSPTAALQDPVDVCSPPYFGRSSFDMSKYLYRHLFRSAQRGRRLEPWGTSLQVR